MKANKFLYSTSIYTSLQLKDIARSLGIHVYYDMPLFEVVEKLNNLNK